MLLEKVNDEVPTSLEDEESCEIEVLEDTSALDEIMGIEPPGEDIAEEDNPSVGVSFFPLSPSSNILQAENERSVTNTQIVRG